MTDRQTKRRIDRVMIGKLNFQKVFRQHFCYLCSTDHTTRLMGVEEDMRRMDADLWTDDEEEHKCYECDKDFPSREALDNHNRSHFPPNNSHTNGQRRVFVDGSHLNQENPALDMNKQRLQVLAKGHANKFETVSHSLLILTRYSIYIIIFIIIVLCIFIISFSFYYYRHPWYIL